MGNTREDIVSPALRSAAPWLNQCPQISIGGISSLLLGGYTSESSAIYVQCQCPECVQQPSDGLHNLEEHVQHVTGDEVSPGNGNSICRNFLFFQSGTTQVSFKAYMKQVGEQYHGKELTGTTLWVFRFDTATTVAANAEPDTGVWVNAEVVGYNDKTGEHEIQFADGSPLAGKRSKIFVGASHVHFGEAAPTAGAAPDRLPPAGLAFELPAHAAATKQQSTAAAEAAVAETGTETEEKAAAAEGVSAAAAAGKTGTRSPSKRQAALAAPAHWAAAGVLAPGAKRAASAAATGVGAANGVSQGKKARVSNAGSADAAPAGMVNGGVMAASPYGVAGYSAPAGTGNLTQQQLMMFAAHTQQMMAANAAGYGEAPAAPGSRARRSSTPSFAAAAPAAAVDQGIKTSRFRGVSWNKRTLKWQVTLYARGRYRYFGSYTDQEEAARAYDRAALVWKGPNAQLNYPASTYLKGNQKAQLQQLQEQAQQEAAKGNEPPPELPPGEAGTAALEAVAAQQEAAAAAAAAAAAGGGRGVGPAVGKAGSKRRVSSGGGGGGQDQADKAAAAANTAAAKRGVVVKDEAGTDQATNADPDTAAAADDDDDDLGEEGQTDDHSMEEDEGTGGEDDQAAGNLGQSNAAGAVAGDVAGTLAGPVMYKKRRKRKAQGKLFTRKKIHKQDIQLQMPIYAASSLRPPPEVMRMLAAAGANKLTPGRKAAASNGLDLGDQQSKQAPEVPAAPPLTKEEQVVAAATAAAAAAAAAGRAVGAAKRKPGRGSAGKPPQAQLQQQQQQQDDEMPPHSRGAAKVKPESAKSEHSGVKSEEGTENPDAVDGAAAGGGSSPGTGSGSDGEGDEGTGAEDGDGAEGIGMRRSQRQAAKKAQKKTARRMASVVNARSDGLWARLMQRAGSDADSSEEGGGSRIEAGVEQGDLEAMAAAAQAAGVSRDVVMNAHEQAKKLLESGVAMSGVAAAARGRGRGRGRGRRGIGKRGRPPGSGIAARMAELYAQFVALGGTYGNDEKAAHVKRESEPGTAGKPPVAGLAATRERRARRTPPTAQPPPQQLQQDMEVDDEQEGAHGNIPDKADGAGSELGDADAASPSELAAAEAAAALAAGDEADDAEGGDEEVDAEAAAAALAAEEDLQEDDEQQQPGDGSDADHDDADGVDDDDADVAALLLGLTGGLTAAAAAADEDDDEGGNAGMEHPHHTPHQHPGYGEDGDHYADDQRSVDMDSWGAAAAGAASRRLGGFGGRSQRERTSNSKYGEEEWAPPRSLRNRGRGRGRGRARGSAASLAATAAASSSGQPYHYPPVGAKGGRGASAPKISGRTFVYAPKHCGGGQQQQQHGLQQPYWPHVGAMAGKSNMPPWMMPGMGPLLPGMMPGCNPAAMAAAAALMPPGMWPGLPGQQKQKQQKRNTDKGGSGSDGELSEGEDQLQQQAEEAAAAAAAAAAAFNRMPPPQMAQQFVQVMFMAFTSGQPKYVMEFQTLYACLCSNPTAWGHVMNLLFQFGTQMGANIAAAGGVAPAMAAAFNSMAEQGQGGGNTGTAAAPAAELGHGDEHKAAPSRQPTSKTKKGGATGEGGETAGEDIPAAAAAPHGNDANTLPGSTEQATAGSTEQATAGKDAADTAAAGAAAANIVPATAADGAAMPPTEPGTGDTALATTAAGAAQPPPPAGGTPASGAGSQPVGALAAATFQAAPGMAGPYNPPAAAAAAAAAAAGLAPDQYMRVMMGLPIDESEDEESVQEDEDEEVARLAAGAAASNRSSPATAVATASPSSAACPPQVTTGTAGAAAAARANGPELHDTVVNGALSAAGSAAPPVAADTADAAGDVKMGDVPPELPVVAVSSQPAVQTVQPAVQPAVQTAAAEPPAAQAVQAVHAAGQAGGAGLPAAMTSQVSPQLGMPPATGVTGSMPEASLVTPQPASQVSPQLPPADVAGVTTSAGMPSMSLVTPQLQPQVSPQQTAMHNTAQAPVQQGIVQIQQLVTPQAPAHMQPAPVSGVTPDAVFQQPTGASMSGHGSMPPQQQQHPMPMMQQHHVLQHSQPQMVPQQQQYMMAGQFIQPPQQQQQQLGMQPMQGVHMQHSMQPHLLQQQQQQQQPPGMVQLGWQPQQVQGFQGGHMQQLMQHQQQQQQQQQQQGPSAVVCGGFAGAMPVYVLNMAPQAGLQQMQPVPSLAQQQQQQHIQQHHQHIPIISQQMPQGGMAGMQPMAPPACSHNVSLGFSGGSQPAMLPAAQQMGPGMYKQEGLQ